MHIENVKDPVEFRLPTGNLVLIILRTNKSGNVAASTVFDDLALNLRNGPGIRASSVSDPDDVQLV